MNNETADIPDSDSAGTCSSEINAARLEQIINCGPVMIYASRIDEAYGGTYVSANVTDILGHSPADFIHDRDFWKKHIHPDDQEQVLAGLPDIFEHDWYCHDYRFQHANGDWRLMHDECRLIRDQQGNPLEIVGYWVDITRKRHWKNAWPF
ncbi:PAS domain S-box-containing protein [Formivibrio citricus]|uniref:histidine kinase n=1 Tax=Formivibrio citricus TaxID=83765 RepID=A0A1I4V517_9NEIS|nr:PAS domain-containing protein [Formivibrio citricus]SFM96296.1 PAS domain S-box-containing protein [Formivibrio citricus]